MKINNRILSWFERHSAGRILLAASLLWAVTLTSCVRGLEDELNTRPGSGKVVKAKLSFDINASSTDLRTRTPLDAGALKIETLWIGVFDSQTGEMVGCIADRPLKNDNTRIRMNDGSGSWTVENMDIWYYDNNPNVYIASVVNFEFVKAHTAGDGITDPNEMKELAELLGVTCPQGETPKVAKRITWDDLRKISVVTSTIEPAMRTASKTYGSSPAEELVLAMGFFNTKPGVHTTIDREGKVPSNAVIPLSPSGKYASEIQLDGRIYLRRMQTDVKVNLVFPTSPNSMSGMPFVVQKVNSLRYRIMNRPVEMYLAEHAVDKIGGSLTGKDNYRSRSANSADWLDNNAGYESDDENNWHKIDVDNPEEINMGGYTGEGYSFSFTHYENKHWGIDYDLEPGTRFIRMEDIYDPYDNLLDLGTYTSSGSSGPPVYIPNEEKRTWQGFFDEVIKRKGDSSTNFLRYMAPEVQQLAAHRIREAKLTDDETNPLFKSLSKSDKASFNNNASYFLIEADITWKSVMDGSTMNSKSCYTVHEGYTSYADGTPLPAANNVKSKSDIYDAICDFQAVRNTKYTYNLGFTGISTIVLQAMAESYGVDGNMHDDGYTGQAWMSGGTIHEVNGAGNMNTNGKGDNYGTIYEFYDPESNYQYVDYFGSRSYSSSNNDFSFLLMPPDYREVLKWRIYEKHRDENGQIVECNYGTCSAESQPDIKDLKDFEALQALPDDDPIKQFYNSVRIHIGTQYNYSSSYVEFESFKEMTLDEYVKGDDKGILTDYPSSTYFSYMITIGGYEVDDDVKNYPDYKRGIYFVMETKDDDGCFWSEFITGIEQNPHDKRAAVRGFEPMMLQSFKYYNNYTDVDFNVYSAAQNFVNTEYIRWFAGAAFYTAEGDDEDLQVQEWTGAWSEYMDDYDIEGNAHEPASYSLYIDGEWKATISNDGKKLDQQGNPTSDVNNYKHSIQHDPSNPGEYLHLDTSSFKSPWYFAWPYNPNELSAGDHTLVIEANYDDGQYKYVQDAKIETTLRIIERPYWSFGYFDSETFPRYIESGNNDFYSYGGMTVVLGNSYSYGLNISDGYARFYNYNYSYYNGFADYNSENTDHDLIRFTVDKHGTFRVRSRLSNYSGSSYWKYLYFKARDTGKTDYFYYNDYTYYSNIIDVYFYTRDIIENFDNGPVEVAFYLNEYNSGNRSYVDIYEIEWETDKDQRPKYPGIIDHTNMWNDNQYFHPYYPYINYSGYKYFYLVPGFVNYYGFTVSNQPDEEEKKAKKYKIGLYNSPNTLNNTPVYEWEINVEDCIVSQSEYDNNTDYYVCPLFISASEMGRFNNSSWYYVGITPVSDDYSTSTTMINPNTSNFRITSMQNDAVEWFSNTDVGNSSYPNPWGYSSYYSGYYFNTSYNNEWSEFLGLVLHNGTGSMDLSGRSIGFGGEGYPLYKGSTREFGRYLSFTTDMPGYVILQATSSGSSTQRYFRLYKVVDGVPVQVDRTPVVDVPFRLSTGRVSELTEFIICPEGGVNLSGARFLHDETIDDRESLDDSTISYVNWSSDPDKPIHPSFYDFVSDYNGENPDFYDYPRQFPLLSHFESQISFSDDNPRATSYKLQLFNEDTFNPNNFSRPDYEVVVGAENQTYPVVTRAVAEGTKVFTSALFVGNDNLESGNYLAFVTPVGDPEIYKPASPQFITLVEYYNLKKPVYPPYPDDEYKDIYMSPVMGWAAAYYTTITEDSDYYQKYKSEEKHFADGEYVEFFGMTLTGGQGDVWITNPKRRGLDGEEHSDWCISFPGTGYPKSNNPGRNLSFTTDLEGKVLIVANSRKDGNYRGYGLWKETSSGAVQIGESKEPFDAETVAMDDIVKPLVFETGEVTGETKFIICPEGGSYLYAVIFIPEGSAAYDWDWENKGFPGSGSDDDDGDDDADKTRSLMRNNDVKKSMFEHWLRKYPKRLTLR